MGNGRCGSRGVRIPRPHCACRATLLAALLAVACASPQARSQSDDTIAVSDMRTVLVDGGDKVGSVLGERDTRAVMAVVHDETRVVQRLLGLPPSSNQRFVALIGPDDPARPSLSPSRGGLHGRATSDALVVVVPMAGGLYLDALRPVIRHEVLHVESFRAELRGPVWWNEGLASVVEAMPRTGDTLELEPFPIELGTVKRRLDLVTDDALLSDRKADLTERGLAGYEYPVYRSFVRFLLDREMGEGEARELEVHAGSEDVPPTRQPFAQLAASALERAQADLPGSLAAWRAWLADLDVLALIERVAQSEDPQQRSRASILLADLAGDELSELLTPAADDLALEMLNDEAGFRGALAFVLFNRASALDEARVVRLCASPDPWMRLTGLAVRRTRGEPVSDEEVRSAWASVTGDRGASRKLLEMRLPIQAD